MALCPPSSPPRKKTLPGPLKLRLATNVGITQPSPLCLPMKRAGNLCHQVCCEVQQESQSLEGNLICIGLRSLVLVGKTVPDWCSDCPVRAHTDGSEHEETHPIKTVPPHTWRRAPLHTCHPHPSHAVYPILSDLSQTRLLCTCECGQGLCHCWICFPLLSPSGLVEWKFPFMLANCYLIHTLIFFLTAPPRSDSFFHHTFHTCILKRRGGAVFSVKISVFNEQEKESCERHE